MFDGSRTFRIAGVDFSVLTRMEAVQRVFDWALGNIGGYVCVTGAHGVVQSRRDAHFRTVLNSASMNCPDGQPTAWLMRLKGFRQAERITGRELLRGVAAIDRNRSVHHVLLGSSEKVTDQMVARLEASFPGIRIEAVINPPFRPLIQSDFDSICEEIRGTERLIIWVGLSTPLQESLALRVSSQLPSAVVVAIGAGFDFVAGTKTEAPRVMTVTGLEWLFRLGCEPRRLWRRYAYVIPWFVILFVRELLFSSTATHGKNTPPVNTD